MLSKRLKQLRSSTPYTQAELADKLGVARTTYAMYEQGKREPDNGTLNKIADHFNVSLDYLLGRTDSPASTPKAPDLSEKDEKDIAKRLEEFKNDIEHSDGLSFDGEPISEEAKESLIESMEHIFRMTQRINKKYTPKKYRDEE